MHSPDKHGSYSKNDGRHAAVIGASMAGLVAARVLTDHFDRVTIIDRDHLPTEPTFRRGVPQSRHLHILLPRGVELLDRLFPGLKIELTTNGAASVQWPRDALWLTAAGWSRRYEHDLPDTIGCSREFLEWHLRQRVLSLDKIHSLQARDVVGLMPNPDGTRIVGVTHVARNRSVDGHSTEELPADLVVDASGRNSRTPKWLTELGYPVPEETKINSFLGYASRIYAPPADFQANWKALYLQAKPPSNPRGAGLFPIEGNRWMVTLTGAGRDYPPTDEDGFVAFARSLRSPVLQESIKDAEPLTPIHGYQRTENQLRHYDRLSRFPEQLLVIGDAVCAFNPVYGQGMTVAAIEAMALDTVLIEQRELRPGDDLMGLSRRFQREAAKRLAGAWLIATGEDQRYPTTEGARPGLSTKLTYRYLDRVIAVATQNVDVNRALSLVFGLIEPPSTLFHPKIMLRALRGATLASGIEQLPAPLPDNACSAQA